MERSDQIGRYGELLFVMEAIKRGFNVLYPDNVYGYDYVIEYEGKFTRVQIKTTNSINENRRYIWNITNKSLGSDVFVFIVIDPCMFFMVRENIIKQRKIVFAIPKKNIDNSYLNNWNIFKH